MITDKDIGFEQLRLYINQECGIYVPEEKAYLFEGRLKQALLETESKNYNDFCFKAKTDKSGELREQIIDAITTNETLWFRDERPWVVIEEFILPKFIESLKSGQKQKISIWSAGCSTGQEPFSLAMLIDRYLKTHSTKNIHPEAFEILATDISPSALFLAISGRYNKIAMSRGLDDYYRRHYFEEKGSISVINDTIKGRINFQKLNLQDSFSPLGTFDMILFRNVAMYFNDEFKNDLFSRLADAIKQDGFFFLGATETLLGQSAPFEQCKHKNAIFYQKKFLQS